MRIRTGGMRDGEFIRWMKLLCRLVRKTMVIGVFVGPSITTLLAYYLDLGLLVRRCRASQLLFIGLVHLEHLCLTDRGLAHRACLGDDQTSRLDLPRLLSHPTLHPRASFAVTYSTGSSSSSYAEGVPPPVTNSMTRQHIIPPSSL
jgi:hypothetical protein